MSSRIDPGIRPEQLYQPERPRGRGVTAEDVFRLMDQVRAQQKAEGSALLRLDTARLDGQIRQVLGDEVMKMLSGVPGFAAPELSRPPTAGELKSLLQQLAQLDQKGLLFAAGNPQDAAGIESPSLKAWGEFVQSPTQAQPGQQHGNDGMGQGQPTRELFSQELVLKNEGPSLRQPQLAGDPFKALSNKQKLDLMTAAFGEGFAKAAKEMGLRDPAALLKAAATPESRAALAQTLGVSRGALTVALSQAEMLSIGAGRHGEQALRPQHLPALRGAGLVSLPQLSELRGLAPGQFEVIYQQVRSQFSGFAKALSGERPILKKDLQHWSRAAGRRKSAILDQDWEESPRGNGDAEEQIMGWYLEHFSELEERRQRSADEKKIVLTDKDVLPSALELDAARDDGLICFWVERPNYNAERPALTERVYVCIDPKTGIIDQKGKE